MVKSSRISDLKRWKRKFLGITDEEGNTTDTIHSQAQKLINIFRQMSVLSDAAKERYNEMLLNISSDTKEELSKLPSGSDVRGYIAYLQEQRGILVEEEEEIDEEKLEEERARAKIIAEAISLSHAQTAEKMQEQSMHQIEQLTKTLAEAQNRNASTEDITKITLALQEAQEQFYNRHRRRSEGEGEGTEGGEGSDAEYNYPPLVSYSGNTAEAIGNAVAEAIVKSQESTSEIISKALGEALIKRPPVQVSDSGGNIQDFANMLAESQEKTAEIISEAVQRVLKHPEEEHKEGIKEIADIFSSSQEKSAQVISTAIKEAIRGSDKDQEGIKEIADLLSSSQEKTAKLISEAIKSTREENIAMIEGSSPVKEVAAMLLESQEKTAQIFSKALVEVGKKEEGLGSNRDIIEKLIAGQEKTSQVLSSILEKIIEREKVEYEYINTEEEGLSKREGAREEEEVKQEDTVQDLKEEELEADNGSFNEREVNKVVSDKAEDPTEEIVYEYVTVDDQGNEVPISEEEYNYEKQLEEGFAREDIGSDVGVSDEISEEAKEEVEYEYITVDEEGKEIPVSKEVLQASSSDGEGIFKEGVGEEAHGGELVDSLGEEEYEYEYEYVTVDEEGNEIPISEQEFKEAKSIGAIEISSDISNFKEGSFSQEPISREVYFTDNSDASDFKVKAYLSEVISPLYSRVSEGYISKGDDQYFDDSIRSEDLIFDEEMEVFSKTSKEASKELKEKSPEQEVAIDAEYTEVSEEGNVEHLEDILRPGQKKKVFATNSVIEEVLISPICEKIFNKGKSFWIRDNSSRKRIKEGPYIVFSSFCDSKIRLDLGVSESLG